MSENDLITIPKETALEVFTDRAKIDPLLARVRAEIDGFVSPGVETAKARKEIASFAFKITRSKTYLEDEGKKLAAVAKELPKKIDACRKHARDTLDVWIEEVRKPLTEWEDAEAARVAAHKLAIENMSVWTGDGSDSASIRSLLARVEAVAIGPECEEFEADYARQKDRSISILRDPSPSNQRTHGEPQSGRLNSTMERD